MIEPAVRLVSDLISTFLTNYSKHYLQPKGLRMSFKDRFYLTLLTLYDIMTSKGRGKNKNMTKSYNERERERER